MPAEKLLTRKQAAEALGMSLATLRRREGKQLHPVMSELGEHLFRAADVAKLARDIAAGRIVGVAKQRRPLSLAERQTARALIRDGIAIGRVAACLRASETTIREHCDVPRAERVPSAKVLQIKAALESGEKQSQRAIAKRFGVSQHTVWRLVRAKAKAVAR